MSETEIEQIAVPVFVQAIAQITQLPVLADMELARLVLNASLDIPKRTALLPIRTFLKSCGISKQDIERLVMALLMGGEFPLVLLLEKAPGIVAGYWKAVYLQPIAKGIMYSLLPAPMKARFPFPNRVASQLYERIVVGEYHWISEMDKNGFPYAASVLWFLYTWHHMGEDTPPRLSARAHLWQFTSKYKELEAVVPARETYDFACGVESASSGMLDKGQALQNCMYVRGVFGALSRGLTAPPERWGLSFKERVRRILLSFEQLWRNNGRKGLDAIAAALIQVTATGANEHWGPHFVPVPSILWEVTAEGTPVAPADGGGGEQQAGVFATNTRLTERDVLLLAQSLVENQGRLTGSCLHWNMFLNIPEVPVGFWFTAE